jgi:hypothetical protein
MSEENNEVVKVPIQMGTKGVLLESFDQMWRFSVAVSRSQFKPKGMEKPEDIMLALQMGYELGLTPLSALQSIAVINGRPGVYGDAALALVRQSGQCEEYQQGIDGDGDKRFAVVVSKRKGMDALRTVFSVDDAKTAGLWMKRGRDGQDTPWVTYPDRMLMFRARGFNLRDNFGDILKGFQTTEELQDYPTTDYARAPLSEIKDPLGDTPAQIRETSLESTAVSRRRGRPPGSTNKPKEKEEINETPKIADTQESAPEPSLEVEKAPEPSAATAEVSFPPLVGQIRQELERIGKTEQRLLSLLNEWRLLKSMATPLEEVEESTLNMVWKRWDTVKTSL